MTNAVHGDAGLRSWLEYVAQTAIDWLDLLDAEDDELGDGEPSA